MVSFILFESGFTGLPDEQDYILPTITHKNPAYPIIPANPDSNGIKVAIVNLFVLIDCLSDSVQKVQVSLR